MNYTKLVLLLGTFITTSSSFGQGILNGGFESGQLSPWFQGANYSNMDEGPENWKVTSSDAHSGFYSATDIGNIELRQNFAAVPTLQIQTLSLWVRQPFGPALSGIYFHYSDQTAPYNRLDTQTTGWEFFDLTSHLDANKSLTGISFFGYSYGSPGRTLIDDISITLVPEPSTSTLFGVFASVAGLLWLQGRRCICLARHCSERRHRLTVSIGALCGGRR